MTALNVTATTISLTWQPLNFLDRNGVIIYYTVKYNSTLRNDSGIEQISGSTMSITLSNLIPYTTYNITIAASTSAGRGPESPIQFVTTKQSGKIYSQFFLDCNNLLG